MKDQIISWLVDYPEPVNVALIANLAAATLNFVVSCSMDNSSFFDQYWAMAPVPIALYYAFNETANWSIAGTRKILALVAVTVWAVRLFSLFFLRPERENDSGGTALLALYEQLSTPHHLLPNGLSNFRDSHCRQARIRQATRGFSVRPRVVSPFGIIPPLWRSFH